MEVETSNFRMLTQFVQGTDSHLMSYGPCVEHLEPGRDRGSRSGPSRESPGAVHGILWKIRLPPPFVVICKRFFESRAHAFDLNPSVSLCMLSVEAQAQLTPLTPLTPLTAWLKGRVLGQHTCPYGLRPRSTLTPLTLLLTPLTAVLMTPNPMGVRNTSP